RDQADGAWRPPIVKTVASRGEGADDVLGAIEQHRAWLVAHGELEHRRTSRAATEIEAIALGQLRLRFAQVHGTAALSTAAMRVVAGETDPYSAADLLVESL